MCRSRTRTRTWSPNSTSPFSPHNTASTRTPKSPLATRPRPSTLSPSPKSSAWTRFCIRTLTNRATSVYPSCAKAGKRTTNFIRSWSAYSTYFNILTRRIWKSRWMQMQLSWWIRILRSSRRWCRRQWGVGSMGAGSLIMCGMCRRRSDLREERKGKEEGREAIRNWLWMNTVILINELMD